LAAINQQGAIKRRRFIKNTILSASSTVLIPSLFYNCNPESKELPAFIPEGDFGFYEGLASFDPSQQSIILWTRYLPAINEGQNPNILLEVATDDKLKQIVVSENLTISEESDYTIRAEIHNLKSNTKYYYRFKNVETGAVTVIGQTRTLPASGELSNINIAFTSCANYELGYFNVYKAIAESSAEFVVHLGDYIYEGYRENHFQGRKHDPPHEIKMLDDYRNRYKQYRRDPDLQNLHQIKPFICVWDDHEFVNNTYHHPNNDDFTIRRDLAMQAWHEYLPCRTDVKAKIFRKFVFGDIVNLVMLDTRLAGREKQLVYQDYTTAGNVNNRFNDDWNTPKRSMLGSEQKSWLINQINTSTAKWQVLGNQVLMGKHYLPKELIPIIVEAQGKGTISEDKAIQYYKRISELVEIKSRSENGDTSLTPQEIARVEDVLPYNLDSWDGYPAEREQIFAATKSRKLISFAGASHNAWHNELVDNEGSKVGTEFATASVTSSGLEGIFGTDPFIIAALEQTNVNLMNDVKYSDASRRGFILATFTANAVTVAWKFVNTIQEKVFHVINGHDHTEY
jgi:alkaline phosphatase D